MSGYNAFARFYDALTANVDYRQRARYFDTLVARFAPEHRSGILLDLACGSGSLSLELDNLGYDVVGVDASPEMLSRAMQKAGDASRRILFLHQSMTELDLFGTVDIAICALDSLNHLPGETALRRTFQKVSLFLNPGGLFLFDVNTAYKHLEVLADNTFVYETDQVFCAWQNASIPEENRVDIQLDFFEVRPDGGYDRYRENFSERVFSHETIAACLAESGLALLDTFGDDTMLPPVESTQRAIYVTRK